MDKHNFFKTMLIIDGIEFEPSPKCSYRYDYLGLVAEIKNKKEGELGLYRQLILKDLFFVIYFVLGKGKTNYKKVNHPFVVKACNEIQDGAPSNTLDIWAREHLKSSCITIGETIQEVLRDSNKSTCIFSYARPVAKKFLFELKELFEMSKLLIQCFPDVIWSNPKSEAPIWSLDDGLILKRSGNRKEPTIYASGLIEGMPTGMHFDRMVFDDIVTEDIAESVDVMEKVKNKIDSAMNLGMDGGTHRILGTYYHHNDPLVYLRDKAGIYTLRLKPATDNGLEDGKSIYLSQERLNFLKTTKTFRCQQLLNPTPTGTQKLNYELIKEVDILPKDLYRFMVIDPAGDSKDKNRGDAWAAHVIGIEPKIDDIGASNLFIINSFISPAGEAEIVDILGRMYIEGGIILKLGYERLGNTTPGWLLHLINFLKSKGRHLSEDNNIVRLAHGGRNKEMRITSALQWPLVNGKVFICKKVPNAYKERLRLEMINFPHWHDDGIDALSYVYDITKDYSFYQRKPHRYKDIENTQMVNMV